MTPYLQLDLLNDPDGIPEYPAAIIHLDQDYVLATTDECAGFIALVQLLTFRDHWATVAQKAGLKLDVSRAFDELVVGLAEVAP